MGTSLPRDQTHSPPAASRGRHEELQLFGQEARPTGRVHTGSLTGCATAGGLLGATGRQEALRTILFSAVTARPLCQPTCLDTLGVQGDAALTDFADFPSAEPFGSGPSPQSHVIFCQDCAQAPCRPPRPRPASSPPTAVRLLSATQHTTLTGSPLPPASSLNTCTRHSAHPDNLFSACSANTTVLPPRRTPRCSHPVRPRARRMPLVCLWRPSPPLTPTCPLLLPFLRRSPLLRTHLSTHRDGQQLLPPAHCFVLFH